MVGVLCLLVFALFCFLVSIFSRIQAKYSGVNYKHICACVHIDIIILLSKKDMHFLLE